MSWSSASSSSSGSASEQRQHEAALPETEAWDAHGAGRGADEGDWLGAFYVPRGEPPAPEWLAVEPPETQDRAQVGAQDKLQSCISCGTLTKDLRQLRCGHLWGGSCLLARIELALRWEGNWPARCCEKIDEGEMRRLAPFLEEGIVKRYLDKYEEMETQRDQRIYCADARCSAFLGPRGTGINWGSCGKCGISTCLKCGNAGQLHGHDQCPPETTVVSHGELIRGGKLQQCPGCPEVVELREACNHTTCLCGTEFCFSCGAFWRTCFCSLYPGSEHEPGEAEQQQEEGEGGAAAEANEAFAAARTTYVHPIFNNALTRARCEYCGYSSRHRMYKCTRCRTAACWDCYERLNMFAVGASALRQEAALFRAIMHREDELGD